MNLWAFFRKLLINYDTDSFLILVFYQSQILENVTALQSLCSEHMKV